MIDDRHSALATASSRAAAQRDRLLSQAKATRDRVLPARLIDDAKSGAKTQARALQDDTIAHVRAHPFLTALGVTALAAWVARKPLIAHSPVVVKAAYGWLSGKLAFSELDLAGDDRSTDSNDEPPNENDNERNSP